MKKPGVMIYFTMRPSRKLPMEDRLRLYDAMLDYGETGVVPELEGPLALLWDYFQPQLELDNARYESIRAKRAKAGRLGGQACQGSKQPEQEPQDGQEEAREAAEANEANEANQANEANEANEANTIQSSTVQSNPVQLRESIAAKAPPAPKKRFVPPTQAEIGAYVREAKLTMDPQEFLDYYTANGWKVGSHAMKDWRAAARNWARKEAHMPRQTSRPAPIVLAPLVDPFDPITY